MDDELAVKESTAGGTLALSVGARLRASIMKGEIAPGERLNLAELKGRFGISFSPLREALAGLAAEGLVVAEGQRGFHVAPVSAANLDELLRLRCMAEGLALRESVQRGDERWEEMLVAAHYRLGRVVEADRTDAQAEQAWEAAHRGFHLALVSACGMPLLLKFCSTLHDLSDRYRRLFLTRSPHDKHVPGEHKKLFDLALARDVEGASNLLVKHIERTGINVRRALTKGMTT